MHTVVETVPYLRAAASLFTPEEQAAIVAMVANDPLCGDLMPGTGGVRKIRFALGNRGKSGGARIIYIVHDQQHPVFLLAAFSKNNKANLTKAERNQLASFVKTLFSSPGEPYEP